MVFGRSQSVSSVEGRGSGRPWKGERGSSRGQVYSYPYEQLQQEQPRINYEPERLMHPPPSSRKRPGSAASRLLDNNENRGRNRYFSESRGSRSGGDRNASLENNQQSSRHSHSPIPEQKGPGHRDKRQPKLMMMPS